MSSKSITNNLGRYLPELDCKQQLTKENRKFSQKTDSYKTEEAYC